MKIGINALFLQNPATGSGQYLLHLLSALAEVDKQNEYILLGPQPLKDEHAASLPFPYSVRSAPDPVTRNENIEKLMWEQLTGPTAARPR